MKKYKPDPKQTYFRLERMKPSHPAWVIFKDPDDITVFQVFMLACCHAAFKKRQGVGKFKLHPIPGVSAEAKRQALDKLVSKGLIKKTGRHNEYKMTDTSPWIPAHRKEEGGFVAVYRGREFNRMVHKEPEVLRLEMWMRLKSFKDDYCRVTVSKLDFISRGKARTGIKMLVKQGVICEVKQGPKMPMDNPIPTSYFAHTESHSSRRPPTLVKFLETIACNSYRNLEILKQPERQPKLGVNAAREIASIQEGSEQEGSKLEGKTIRECPSPDLATDEPPSLTEDLPTSSVDLPVVEARPSAGPTSEQFSFEYVASLPPVGHCVQPAEANSPDCTPAEARDQVSSTSYPDSPAGESLPPTPADASLQDSTPTSPAQVEYGRSSEEDLSIRTSRLIQKLEVLPHLEHEEYTALWNFIHMRLSRDRPPNSRDLNELFHMLHNPEYPEIWIQYFEQLVRDQNPNFNPGTLGGRYAKASGEEVEQLLGSSQAYTYYIQLKQYLFPNGDLALEKKWKHHPDPEAWAEGVLEGCRLQMHIPFSPVRVEACAMRLLCEQQEWRRAGAQAAELYHQLTVVDPDLQNATEAFALRFYRIKLNDKQDPSGFRR